MGLSWGQFKHGVLRPTMRRVEVVLPTRIIGVDSEVAVEQAVRLVGETLWHESDKLQALGQYPRGGVTRERPFGPGLGISSFERPTWNWLEPIYRHLVPSLGFGGRQWVDYEELAWNLSLNVVACRIRYYVDRFQLPSPDDGIEGRAAYWYRVYNASGVDSRRVKYIEDAKVIPWE